MRALAEYGFKHVVYSAADAMLQMLTPVLHIDLSQNVVWPIQQRIFFTRQLLRRSLPRGQELRD